MLVRPKPIIAIPDIHGYARDLLELLEALDSEDYLLTHRLVFLGDLVDRGPDSRDVIDLVCQMVSQGHISICGNHDFVFKQALFSRQNSDDWMTLWRSGYESGVLKSYGLPTNLQDIEVRDALLAVMPIEHQNLFANMPWFYEDFNHVCVHAGLLPDTTWRVQRTWLRYRIMPPDCRPVQLFSGSLGRAEYNRVSGKTLITGHARRKLPFMTHSRVMLDCGIDQGGFLAAFISDEHRCIRSNFGHIEEVATTSA